MPSYPTGIYAPRERENKPGYIYDPDDPVTLFAEDVEAIEGEVVAIENELGLNPAGGSGNVAVRLLDIEGELSSLNVIKARKDGWEFFPACAYASADAPSFVMNITGDLTTDIQPGDRIKLTQTTIKYFIVTAVGAYAGGVTPITMYGGTDYVLANAAINDAKYSKLKSPQGFPMDPDKWTIEISNTSSVSQVNPVDGTWYNLGSIQIVIPIGVWDVRYILNTEFYRAGATFMLMSVSVSTSNNSNSDLEMTSIGGGNTVGEFFIPMTKEKIIARTSKITYYLIGMSLTQSATAILFRGDLGNTVIRAKCAYL